MTMLDRAGVCVCGVSVSLHFDGGNRRLTCAVARAREARARRAIPARVVDDRRVVRGTTRLLSFSTGTVRP